MLKSVVAGICPENKANLIPVDQFVIFVKNYGIIPAIETDIFAAFNKL